MFQFLDGLGELGQPRRPISRARHLQLSPDSPIERPPGQTRAFLEWTAAGLWVRVFSRLHLNSECPAVMDQPASGPLDLGVPQYQYLFERDAHPLLLFVDPFGLAVGRVAALKPFEEVI